MNFTYFSHRECPICGGARKDCRQNTQNGLIHCRDGSATPVGFHLIGEDALGFFMWAEGDGKDGISQEERERRELDRRIKRQRREEEKRRGALPIPERDAAIRKLHAHFGLGKNHRADLKRRGLSDEQIDRLRFFTIQPGDRVPSGVPENLPGIRYGKIAGSQGFAYTEGFACPTFTPERQASGYQIRLDGTVEGGKYRWAKGAVSSHLPNGELPITYVRPLDGQIKRRAIGMCEGILKPAIASQKLGQIFIGASGLQFGKEIINSEGKSERVLVDQGLEYLEAASKELEGTKEVHLYADAGVVRNPQIYQKYQWLINELAKLGYSVKIAWWGQIDKRTEDGGQPDCDELPEDVEIKLITPGKFADFAKRFGGADSAYMQKVRREWKKKRTFTPDIVSSSKYVNWDRPADGTVFFGKGGLGSGKTTRFIRWAEQWKAEDDSTRFFVLGYRNSLLYQTIHKMSRAGLNLEHVNDAEAVLRADRNTSFALCVDSLWKFQPEDFDDSVLFLDEINSVIRHILHSRTIPKVKRDKIQSRLEDAVRRARIVVCMDGLLADWAVHYLAAIAPDKKIIKAQNVYNQNKPVIRFSIGTQELDGKIKPNDRSPWVKLMLEAPMPVVCSDSQIFLEGLDEIFQANGAKTLRIDSKTIPEDYAKEFLRDCDKYIRDNEIDVLLYSPSAESGLDVSIENWFTHQFAFFFGILSVDAIIQKIGRIRDSKVERFVWCKEWVAVDEQEHSKSPSVEEIKKTCGWNLEQDIGWGIDLLKKEFSRDLIEGLLRKLEQTIYNSYNHHALMAWFTKSLENAEKANLRSFLREALLTEGYGVVDFILPPDLEAKELEQRVKEEVRRRNCSDIFNAPVKDEEVKDLASSRSRHDAKWDERCRRMKAVYLDRLPGIKESGQWNEDFIYYVKYEEPDFISRLELFWLLQHPEEAEKETIRRVHWFARTDRTFIGQVRSRFQKVRAYKKLDIHRFLDLDAVWTDDSPEIQDLLKRCKDPAIANALGHPGKRSGIKNLTRLLKPLGISFRGHRPHEGARFYKVDTEAYFDPKRFAVLEAIDVRYAKLKSEEKPLEWNQIFDAIAEEEKRSTYPHNILINTGICGAAETIDNTSVSADFGKTPNFNLAPTGNAAKSTPCYHTEKTTENKSPEKSVAKPGEIFWAGKYPLMIPSDLPTKNLADDTTSEQSSEKSNTTPTRQRFFCIPSEVSENTSENQIGVHVGESNNKLLHVDTDEVDTTPIRSGKRLFIIPQRVSEKVAAVATPKAQSLVTVSYEPVQVLEHHWDELPKPGAIVRWVDRGATEKLILKSIDPDGRCQVKSLATGWTTNTRVDQLKPDS